MSILSGLLTALRDISFDAAPDQPRNRQGHFGARLEDGAGGIGDGAATDAEHGAQLAAARRFQVHDGVNQWLRGDRSPAWGSDQENHAMVAKLDALIARHQLPGPLVLYVAIGGDMLAALRAPGGNLVDKAYTYGSRLQSIARADARGDEFIARVTAPAGMDVYLFPEVSDPMQGILLPRGLTLTTSAVNETLRTLAVDVTAQKTNHLAELLTTLRDLTWLYSDDEPRDDQGQWTDGGASGPAVGSRRDFHVAAAKNAAGKHVAADGSALPAHIQALTIPPAWTDVTYNPDPNAALLATGKDASGKRQPIYAQSFMDHKAAGKFNRIVALSKDFPAMHAANETARSSSIPTVAAHADVTALVMHTGIRPGSETDTHSKLQAYGATTLQGQHVVAGEGGAVSLQYVGKSGKSLNIPISNPSIASMLLTRKAAAGDGNKIFPGVSDDTLRDHVHTLSANEYHPKDFRTLAANVTAASEVAKMPVPKTQAEYQKSVRSVAVTVSKRLGNTPAVALQSYINPHVFVNWRA